MLLFEYTGKLKRKTCPADIMCSYYESLNGALIREQTLIKYKHVGPCECVRLETSEFSATCNSDMIYLYHALVCLRVKISCTDKVSCLAWIVVCGINLFPFPIMHWSLIEQCYREYKYQYFKCIITHEGSQRNRCSRVFTEVPTFCLGIVINKIVHYLSSLFTYITEALYVVTLAVLRTYAGRLRQHGGRTWKLVFFLEAVVCVISVQYICINR